MLVLFASIVSIVSIVHRVGVVCHVHFGGITVRNVRNVSDVRSVRTGHIVQDYLCCWWYGSQRDRACLISRLLSGESFGGN